MPRDNWQYGVTLLRRIERVARIRDREHARANATIDAMKSALPGEFVERLGHMLFVEKKRPIEIASEIGIGVARVTPLLPQSRLMEWKCGKCEHTWTAVTHRRSSTSGKSVVLHTNESCPKCERRRIAEHDAKERAIQHLRTMPYAEYLQTPHWHGKRNAALQAAKYRCQTCYAKGELHVHHRTYERRGCEALSDLTVLCKQCHETFHASDGDARVRAARTA